MRPAALIVLFLLQPVFSVDLAEYISASGSLHWFNAKGTEALPCRQWPLRMVRLDSAGTPLDTVEARTDNYGQYALYGLPAGGYSLEVPRGFGRVHRQAAKVPGRLKPIVLPPRLPALADTSVFPIRVEADYETLGEKRYRFRLWIRVPPEWKPLVRKVNYFMNHPSFTRKTLIGRDSSADFSASYLGWGCLQNVSVDVFFPHETWRVEFPFCDELRAKSLARKSAKPPAK